MSLKLMSLFDGSGGFPLAASLCGFTPVYASEVEPYPIAVTRSRFPDMVHIGDVSKVNGAELEPVDIISFGSPCQDLSVAGLRKGMKHEENGDDETTRSGLFMEAIRIIREMREATNGKYPTFAIWENVTGAFSSNGGEDFRMVLESFIRTAEPNAPALPRAETWPKSDVIMGDKWSVAYRTFDAQYWGVPQRRRRVYLVADFRGRRADKVLFEREGLRRHPSESGQTREGAAGTSSDRSGTANRAGAVAIENHPNDSRVDIDNSGTVQTLTGSMASGKDVSGCLMASGYDKLGGQEMFSGDYTVIEEVTPPDFHYWNGDQVAGTLTANNAGGGQRMPDKENFNCVISCEETTKTYIVRRLTPIECARLQGFPDWWGQIDYKEDFTEEEYHFWLDVRNTMAQITGKAVKEYTKEQMVKWYNKLHTDSAEYKMWGNGIALPCALYVMEGIESVLDEGG